VETRTSAGVEWTSEPQGEIVRRSPGRNQGAARQE